MTNQPYLSDTPVPDIYLASLENPNVSFSDPSVWDSITSVTTATGISISPQTALMVPAFWQAVSMISADVAQLPLCLYRKDDRDSRERMYNHPVDQLVSKIANPDEEESAFSFWHKMMASALIMGNSYAWIDRDDSGPKRLVFLMPGKTKTERVNGVKMYFTMALGAHGAPVWVPLDPYEVFHLKGMCFGADDSCELLKYGRESLALSLAAGQFAGKFFKNGGRVGGILQFPESTPKQVRDQLEKTFRETYEDVDKAFKTVVLRDWAKFTPGQMSAQDTQLVEARKEAVREVARLFNLTPSKLGEESGGGYNSKAEDNRDYIDRTLSYWLTAIATEANVKLLDRKKWLRGDWYLEHNTKRLEWMDLGARYSAYAIGRTGGWLTPNDVLRFENLPLIDGPEGDNLQNPNTSSPFEPPKEPQVPEQDQQDTTNQGADTQAALRKLAMRGIQRRLNVAADKIAKQSVQADFCGWYQNGGLLMALNQSLDLCSEEFEALVAVSNMSVASIRVGILARALTDFTAILDRLVGVCAVDQIREAVKVELGAWLNTFAEAEEGKNAII